MPTPYSPLIGPVEALTAVRDIERTLQKVRQAICEGRPAEAALAMARLNLQAYKLAYNLQPTPEWFGTDKPPTLLPP